MKKTILFAASLLFLAACTGTKFTQADADRIASGYPNTTVAQLQEGQSLYKSYCKMCHALPKPDSHNEEQWKKIIPGMVAGVNKKSGSEKINAEGQEAIMRYVMAAGGLK